MFEAIWNSTELESPPIATFLVGDKSLDLNSLRRFLSKVKEKLKKMSFLDTERALLSRGYYKMKQKFRNEKGVKTLRQVERCLFKLHAISFPLAVDFYLNSLPSNYDFETYLPSRQMLEYVLIKLQGFSKLLCRVMSLTRKLAEHMTRRLKLGHMWEGGLFGLACASRTWCLARYFVKEACSWYKYLLTFHKKLQRVGPRWLPKSYIFPVELDSWLGVDWAVEIIDLDKMPDIPIFSLLEDSDDDVVFLGINNEDEDDCIYLGEVEPESSKTGHCSSNDHYITKSLPQDKKALTENLAANTSNDFTLEKAPKKKKIRALDLATLDDEDVGEVVSVDLTKQSTESNIGTISLKNFKKSKQIRDFISSEQKSRVYLKEMNTVEWFCFVRTLNQSLTTLESIEKTNTKKNSKLFKKNKVNLEIELRKIRHFIEKHMK